MAYIGNAPVLQTTQFREEFFPSSNQSAFTTGGFHPSAVSVTRNGVLLSESDYTKGSDNVTITLANAAVSGDVVVIRGNRSLAQGVSVSESRVEYTWQSGDTVVQLNADVIPAYTDVYVNGIKLWYGDGSGDGTNSDYSINAALKQVSFFADPAVGDVIAVVHKNETSALVALPLKKSNGTTLISEDSNGVVSLHSDILATTTQVQGVHATVSAANAASTTQLTSVAAISGYSLSDISVGDYAVGERIIPGTTVTDVNLATGIITLSQALEYSTSPATSALSGDPVSFYNATKALSAGTVAGGLCRAWICFGMVSGTPIARGAHNISSISDRGAGNYDLNLTTAMPDENGCIVCSTLRDAETVYVAAGRWISSSVITVRVNSSNNNVLYANLYNDLSENIFCAIFR